MKQYYRHALTGDLGYLVSRDGRDFIRFDRPLDPTETLFRPERWLPEVEPRPLTTMQVAKIAFEADKYLCAALGMPEKSKAPWINLRDDERILWLHTGPTEPVRQQLYLAIASALQELTVA